MLIIRKQAYAYTTHHVSNEHACQSIQNTFRTVFFIGLKRIFSPWAVKFSFLISTSFSKTSALEEKLLVVPFRRQIRLTRFHSESIEDGSMEVVEERVDRIGQFSEDPLVDTR